MGIWPLRHSFLVMRSTPLEYTVLGSGQELTGVSRCPYPISPCAPSCFESNDYFD